MNPRRAVPVAIALVAAITVTTLGMSGRGTTTRPRPTTNNGRGELAPVDRAAIQRVATQFAVAVSDHHPAQPAAAELRSGTDLVTAGFGRELADQRPVVTAAELGTVQRLEVVSVAVRPGTPATALVLGTLRVDTPGEPTIRAPVTWILTMVDTPDGWRVAGARS